MRGTARILRLCEMRAPRPKRALTPQEIAGRASAAKALAANAERDARIAALEKQGKSYAEIGRLVGLSRERVRVISDRLDRADRESAA